MRKILDVIKLPTCQQSDILIYFLHTYIFIKVSENVCVMNYVGMSNLHIDWLFMGEQSELIHAMHDLDTYKVEFGLFKLFKV